MPDQSKQTGSTDPRVQLALREYFERVDRGETVNRDEFLARHVEIARDLRSFFAAEDPLRKMAVTKISDETASITTRTIADRGQETVPPKLQPDGSRAASGSGLAGQFGRYQILSALGQGAMGAVYLAQDTQLNRHVAIKTPHLEEDSSGDLLKRFYREAVAAATVRHPNICPIYDVGEIDGKHFISMAYIEGRPLSALIHGSHAPQERKILITVHKLAQALQHAHEQGIVHRDLKPANIMVDKRNEPIIMDFGLARQLERDKNIRLTQSGMLIGTPAYMSPEQIDGEPDKVGPPSDQYSLGVILYELLTGQLPFRGSLTAVMAQILTKEPARPSQLRPGLDLRIEAACLKMMAKNPNDRFASLKAVADELAAILRNPGGKQTSPEPGPAPGGAPKGGAATLSDPNVSASAIRQSAAKKSIAARGEAASLAATDVVSLEELARKCLARRDFDQVIQIIDRIPEARRTAGLDSLLENARGKADEISFLIVEIDEALRLNDRATALRKADELLAIKPGHHRALKVQEQFAGYGTGGAARIGLKQFTQPWRDGGWIPWGVLAFGLAVFSGMTAVIVVYLNKTAIVIDVKDPGIVVSVKGKQITIAGPKMEQVTVEPGEQELKIRYAGLETSTKRFELKHGQQRRVTVSIVNQEVVARLEGESLPLLNESEKAGQGPPKNPVIAGKSPKVVPTPKKQPNPAPHAAPQLASAAPVAPPQTKAPPATRPSDEFVPLFNGRDLTGWKVDPSQPGNWRVENGILIGSGSDASHLYSERGDFQDFDLRLEARINEQGNSGVNFRAKFGPVWPAKAPKFPRGYEAQIDSSNHPAKTGSLFVGTGGPSSGRATVSVNDPLVPPGQWFSMEIIAQGVHIVIKVDGREVVSRDDFHFAKGHLALQQLETQTVVEFRKIEIKELELSPGDARPARQAASRRYHPPDGRRLWKGSYSSFENVGPEQWHETFHKHKPGEEDRGNDFDEVARKRDYVEFFDPKRSMHIRLSNKSARWFIEGKGKNWGTFQNGGWER